MNSSYCTAHSVRSLLYADDNVKIIGDEQFVSSSLLLLLIFLFVLSFVSHLLMPSSLCISLVIELHVHSHSPLKRQLILLKMVTASEEPELKGERLFSVCVEARVLISI